MNEIRQEELMYINGGKLETVSDYLLLGGGVAACFVSPWIGVPMVVAVALWA
jgi:hypothetical protein